MQATLDSVSVAIAATGALMPFISYNGEGQANTTGGNGINNVVVNFADNAQTAALSDTTGAYFFSSTLETNTDYALTAEKPDDTYANGVSGADILLIRRHILGLDTFTSPLQRIAADADRNAKISTFDLIRLRKIILGVDIELEFQPPWIFVNANYQFQNTVLPYNEVYSGQATQVPIIFNQPYSLDFIGIKIGDVNNSVNPGN